jgi:phosphatidylglycerophosphate synthase
VRTAATHVTAILSGPQPVDGDSHLRNALTGLGVTVLTADGPAATARAVASASHSGRVALVDPRLAAHAHALRLALLDPRWTAAHAPGVLVVSGAARDLLAAELRAMPDLTAHRVDGTSPAARLTAPKPLLADEFAERLRIQGVAVHETVLPPGLVASLVSEPLSARKDVYAAIDAVDDEAIRLRRAVKGDDGLFTTYCVSPWTRYLARWAARRGWTPNFVTALSLLIALAGAGAAATGTRAGYICTAFALYFSFALDCTDGQLARYSLQFSQIGSWLDATFDRAKEYAVYAGLALGAVHGGGKHDHGVWLLAASAMVLQTLRHHIDFAYHESLRGQPVNEAPTAPPAASAGQAPRRSPGYWARKVVVLPIGERWALIAILAAFASPRIVFSVLLIWGVLAAAYTTAGRVQRSLAGNTMRTEEAVSALRAMCDLPLAIKAAAREPLTAKLGWLTPPTIQLVAYVVALGLILNDALLGAATFALLGAVIYHHYDVVYRIRANAAQPPHWLSVALGGNLGRSVLIVVLGTAIGSGRTLSLAVWLLAGYLAVLAVGESVRFWTRPAAPVLPD